MHFIVIRGWIFSTVEPLCTAGLIWYTYKGPRRFSMKHTWWNWHANPADKGLLKPRSHLADLTADLCRPWWSGEVLGSRRKVGKERGWVLEGPGRSVNLVEVSPTVPGCFELFKTIGSGREWRAVVDKALGSRVRSLEGRWVSVNKVGKGRAWSGRNQDGHRNRPTTTE